METQTGLPFGVAAFVGRETERAKVPGRVTFLGSSFVTVNT